MRRLNALPGFVWRLKDEGGDATQVQAFEDPSIMVNMFGLGERGQFRGVRLEDGASPLLWHAAAEWFGKLDGPHFAMWWVEPACCHGGGRSRARIEHLAAHGPSDHAFGWESLKQNNLWMTARCA